MVALKIRQVGNSAGVVLPKELLSEMRVGIGDTLYLTKSPGGYRLSPYDPTFEEEMRLAREIMDENRDVLRELAK